MDASALALPKGRRALNHYSQRGVCRRGGLSYQIKTDDVLAYCVSGLRYVVRTLPVTATRDEAAQVLRKLRAQLKG
jgi:hypothetical protein